MLRTCRQGLAEQWVICRTLAYSLQLLSKALTGKGFAKELQTAAIAYECCPFGNYAKSGGGGGGSWEEGIPGDNHDYLCVMNIQKIICVL